MGVYDGAKKPVAEHDPGKEMQFALDKAVKELGQALFQIVDTAVQAVMEIVKELVDIIVGFVTIPANMLTDLANWVSGVPTVSGGTLDISVIPDIPFTKITGNIPLARIDDLIDPVDGYILASLIRP